MPSSDSPMQEFDAVATYLQAVSEILREGHMPDINALEDKISHLCSIVQNADSGIQEEYIAKLNELLIKLNACEEQMDSLQAAMTLGEKK